ncbi:MAG: hypothetical protein JWL80_613 [Parcubacteria group bacterium]|nr:hypothetical protein [Parcubacteria group bacterium]
MSRPLPAGSRVLVLKVAGGIICCPNPYHLEGFRGGHGYNIEVLKDRGEYRVFDCTRRQLAIARLGEPIDRNIREDTGIVTCIITDDGDSVARMANTLVHLASTQNQRRRARHTRRIERNTKRRRWSILS